VPGFGRTGRFYAVEHAGVEPDLLVTGKSLAAGLPLAGVTGRAELMDAPQVGGLGGTYGGNPLACAAALAVLEVMEREELVTRAREIGVSIMARFSLWQQRFAGIGEVRGIGAMCGMELVEDRQSKAPARALTTAVLSASLERGLIILKSGVYDNVVRVLLPLVISDADLDRGLGMLEDALVASGA